MRSKLVTGLQAAVDTARDRILTHRFLEEIQNHKLDEQKLMRFFCCSVKEEAVFPYVLTGTLYSLGLNRPFKPAYLALSKVLIGCLGRAFARNSHHEEIARVLALAGGTEQSRSYKPRSGLMYALELERAIASGHGPVDVTLGYTLTRNTLLCTCYNVILLGCDQFLSDEREALLHHRVDTGDLNSDLLWRAIDALPAKSHSNVNGGIGFGEKAVASLLDEAWGVYDHSEQPQ